MAARNTKQTETGHSKVVVFLRLLCKLNTILFAAVVLTAYSIKKLGYIESHLPDVHDEGTQYDSSADSWYRYWTLSFWWDSTDNPRKKRLHQVYPKLYKIVKFIDCITNAIFQRFDDVVYYIYTTVYQSLAFIVTQAFGLAYFLYQVAVNAFEFLYPDNVIQLIKSVVAYVSNIQISSYVIILLAAISFGAVSILIIRCFSKSHASTNKKGDEFIQELDRHNTVVKSGQQVAKLPRSRKRIPVKRATFVILGLCFMMSLPWEFIRLYQAEIAKKASVTLQGAPPECVPGEATLWQSLKIWLSWQFSWQQDPCEKYHHALLVDPLWEVTPMLVLSSLLSRCISAPVQSMSSTIGTSLRVLLQEIPAHWQPVVMATIILILLLVVLMVCSYRVSMPLFLRIEPSKKTPIIIKTCGNRRCLERAKETYRGREILGVELMTGDDQEDCGKGNEAANWSQISDSQISEWDF